METENNTPDLVAVLDNGDVFKKVIDGIKELVSEGNVDCSEDGMSLQGMDSSHVALVSFMLRTGGFSEFDCENPCVMGVNFGHLNKILKCSTAKDKLTIRLLNTEMCQFVFENTAEDRSSLFELKLLDIDAESLEIPETEYNCIVKMSSAEFKSVTSNLSQLGDTVQIRVTKEGVKFSTKGDIGNAELICRASSGGGDNDVEIEMSDEVDLSFALRYLTLFTKCSSLSKTVSLSLSPEIPLVVEYTLEDLGYIRFYLAPKLDDEDD